MPNKRYKRYVIALNGVRGATSETLQDLVHDDPNDPPSILIESAVGITTFPTLGKDFESERAKGFINRRLEEVTSKEAAEPHQAQQPPQGSL